MSSGLFGILLWILKAHKVIPFPFLLAERKKKLIGICKWILNRKETCWENSVAPECMCDVQSTLRVRWTTLVSSCGQMTAPASSASIGSPANCLIINYLSSLHSIRDENNKILEFKQVVLMSGAFWNTSSVSSECLKHTLVCSVLFDVTSISTK